MSVKVGDRVAVMVKHVSNAFGEIIPVGLTSDPDGDGTFKVAVLYDHVVAASPPVRGELIVIECVRENKNMSNSISNSRWRLVRD